MALNAAFVGLDRATKIVSDASLSVSLTMVAGVILVEIDPNYFRPTEVEFLLGDATKAKQKLGWEPKVSFGQLVELMVKHDLECE